MLKVHARILTDKTDSFDSFLSLEPTRHAPIRYASRMISLDLSGKVALIAGVQNEYSLGWAAGKKLLEAGATCVFSFQGERNLPALEKLTAPYKAQIAFLDVCDVSKDEDLEKLFARIKSDCGRLDFVMHAIAFTPRSSQENPFLQTTRSDWQIALDVSAYSLVALAQHAAPLMESGSSIVALSYYAAEKVVAKYNVMGIAKSALESDRKSVV